MKAKLQPLTPTQALNNFRLFLELSPRNSYAQYRAAVREIALTCLAHGIRGALVPLDNPKAIRAIRALAKGRK